MDVNLGRPNRYLYVVQGEMQLSKHRPCHRLHKPTLHALEILSPRILRCAIKSTETTYGDNAVWHHPRDIACI